MTNNNAGKPILSKLHEVEYSTTDLSRQSVIQDIGLAEYEKIFIDKYFKAKKNTLEIGTGGASCFCFGATGFFGYSCN